MADFSKIEFQEIVKSAGKQTGSFAVGSKRVKNYYCEYEGCYKSFTRPSVLTEHQEIVHHGIKPFLCDVCERAFTKKSHLERHLYTHSEEKPFSCSHCGKGVTTRQQLRRHEITHTKAFKCTFEGCSEAFYKHPQLRSHILSVHEQKLTCQKCGKKFQRLYRLNNHIAKHHNPDIEYKYQCVFPSCVHAFKTWSTLQQHIKTEHPKIPCKVCGKQCVGEIGIQMHANIHDDTLVTKNWKCDRCEGSSFAKKADLVTHYMDVHNDSTLDDIIKPIAKVEDVTSSEVLRGDEQSMNISRRTRRRLGINMLNSIDTEVKLRKYIDSGKSTVNLLLNSSGRRIFCSYLGCSRSFKTQEKYDAHKSKHKVHDLKMKIMEEKDSKPEVTESSVVSTLDTKTY